MKFYGMTVNGENRFYRFETDRNYAWNLLMLTDPIAANRAKFFEITMN
jgi:hypothetical protein